MTNAKYPVLLTLARCGTGAASVGALLALAIAIYLVGTGPLDLAIGVVFAVVAFVALKAIFELVDLITEMLLPK